MNIFKEIVDGKDIDVEKLDFKWFIIKHKDPAGRKDKKGNVIEHWTVMFGDPRVTIPFLSMHGDEFQEACHIVYDKCRKTWQKYIDAMHGAHTADPSYAVCDLANKNGNSLKDLKENFRTAKTLCGFDVTKLIVFDLDDEKTVDKVCA